MNPISGTKTTQAACGRFTWNGTTYTNSGTFTYQFTNGSGCTIVDTLVLKISTEPAFNIVSSNGLNFCTGQSTTLMPSGLVALSKDQTLSYVNSSGNTVNVVLVRSNGVGVLTSDINAPIAGGLGLVCNALSPGSLAGKIALIQRGTCTFAGKAKNAQNAGAVAVILYNNVAGAAFGPSIADPTVTIPVFMITLTEGQTLESEILSGIGPVSLVVPPTYSYLWSNSSTDSVLNTCPLQASTTYSLKVTNSKSACSFTDTVTLTVNQPTHLVTTQTACTSFTW